MFVGLLENHVHGFEESLVTFFLRTAEKSLLGPHYKFSSSHKQRGQGDYIGLNFSCIGIVTECLIFCKGGWSANKFRKSQICGIIG